MKHLKPYACKLKWFSLIVKLLATSPAFRSLYFSVYTHPSRFNEQIKVLRKLLQKNPSWAYGHYLLGILSCQLYQLTGDPMHKGTLQICMEAVTTLDSRKKYEIILKELSLFIGKEYKAITDNSLPFPDLDLRKGEKQLLHEAIGFSQMITGNESAALEVFYRIPPETRSREAATAIQKLEGRL